MDDEYSGEHQRPSHHGHHQASTAELMENAKYLAGAIQSAVGGKTDSIDKAKAASAAEGFLGAAQQYGKFDETSGIGKYVSKAEDYLHKYHSSDSAGAGREDEAEAPVSDHRHHERRDEGEDDRRHERRDEDEDEGYRRHERRDEDEEEGYRREEKEDRRHQNRRHEEEEEETGSGGGSGVGEYINMAKGFFK